MYKNIAIIYVIIINEGNTLVIKMILKNNEKLKEKDFVNEKELQTYFEEHLKEILGLEFVATEFVVGSFRLDTVAFDEETKSFKIIEYKNVKNHSLVDQGYTYLKLLLERKADFVLQYNLKLNKHININDVDWSQSRIIFVSPVFTSYQLNATDFKNIPVDLYKVTRYEDNIVDIEHIQKTSSVKIEEVKIDNSTSVTKEIKVYTEEDHLNKVPEKIKNIYLNLRDRILELDDIDLEVKKVYIAFKGNKNIVDIELMQKKLILFINMKKGTLTDPLNITIDLSNAGHHGNGDYCVDINNLDQIDSVIPLIKQSLTVNKK